jgi:hypothetical protein
MLARVLDPVVSRVRRGVELGSVVLFLAAAFDTPIPTAGRLFAAGAALAVAAFTSCLRVRRTFTPARLELGAGYVEIREQKRKTRRIRARDVAGATTARTERGVLLTLALKGDPRPHSIEVANETEAAELRRALGIGHDGFGTITWQPAASRTQAAGFTGRVTLGLLGSTVALAAIVDVRAGIVTAALGSIVFVFALLAVGLGAAYRVGQPTVVMAPEGLRVRSRNGKYLFFPYAAVHSVTREGNALHFVLAPPAGHVVVDASRPLRGEGLSEDEGAALAAQIEAAGQRARGLGKAKRDVTGALDTLRRKGEALRAWLARLDTTGKTLATGKGYRSVDVDAEALWEVLEDPDASTELRVAAARVLRHGADEASGARIEAALSAARDEQESTRLRIAVRDDLDDAREELAQLDAELAFEEQHPAYVAAARRRGVR